MPKFRVYDRNDEYFPTVEADYPLVEEGGIGFYRYNEDLVAYFYAEFVGGFQDIDGEEE